LFDLFFHGDSTLNSKNVISNEYWRNAIIKFTQVENLSNFDVLGYSMGAKFALLTYESFPTRVKQLYLIAPDGLYTSFWYDLATKNFIGRKLFKYIVSKPAFFFSLLGKMDKFNLIDKATLKFANLQMDSIEKRLLLYRVWTNFSGLELPINDICLQLRKHYTPITYSLVKMIML
jgi:pimeloyl-ACP methyl ester carboxylesterase